MPIAFLDCRLDSRRNGTAACVVLRSFDSLESLEERVVRVRQPASDLALLQAGLESLTTEIQVVVIPGYVWAGAKRPGLGAQLFQALGESVSVLGVAREEGEGRNPEVLEVVRGRASRPVFVTSVGFPPPVVGKLVRAMRGQGRIPQVMARAAALCSGHARPKRFVSTVAPTGARRRLPALARINRRLPPGDHRYLELLPGVEASPALRRISPDPRIRERLLREAVVQIRGQRGYAFVDVETPCIVLSEQYYRSGSHLDLYLDLLHELTHLRQLTEGFDLWDERFEYVDRPTEVEGYAVAIEEGRRLGMTEQDVFLNLSNPWMTETEVRRLIRHVDTFLGGGPLPNLTEAREVRRRKVWRPW